MNIPAQLERIERSLHVLTLLVRTLLAESEIIMADLATLEAQVRANADAEDSAILLINGLAAQLAAAATDPAKVNALAAQLKASADRLGAAVVANTPPAPVLPVP